MSLATIPECEPEAALASAKVRGMQGLISALSAMNLALTETLEKERAMATRLTLALEQEHAKNVSLAKALDEARLTTPQPLPCSTDAQLMEFVSQQALFISTLWKKQLQCERAHAHTHVSSA